MYKTLIAIALASVALSAPTKSADKKCRPTQTSYTAKYDDLSFNDGSFNPIPPHYYGLSYITFQVDQYDGFIRPASGSQWAMAFGGSGNISIPDSPASQTFSLDSFSYACVAGIPQPECAISVTGWKDDGKILTREITFPRLGPGHTSDEFKMNATRFDWRWKDLKSVGFSIARKDNGGDMYGGLALDDVKYTIMGKQC